MDIRTILAVQKDGATQDITIFSISSLSSSYPILCGSLYPLSLSFGLEKTSTSTCSLLPVLLVQRVVHVLELARVSRKQSERKGSSRCIYEDNHHCLFSIPFVVHLITLIEKMKMLGIKSSSSICFWMMTRSQIFH